MKRTCWLIFLVVGLPSLAQAQVFPPPPVPVQVTVPNCPTSPMGQVGGIFYYTTGTCPVSTTTGFGQNTIKCLAFGCVSPSSTVCNCSATVLPVAKAEKKHGGFELSACSLPDGTPAERAYKLKEIIKECKRLEQYLKKLTAPGQTDLSLDHKTRIQTWLNYMPGLLTYLEGSPTAPDPVVIEKIMNYCDGQPSAIPPVLGLIPTFREHEDLWSTTIVELSGGRKSHVPDEQQPEDLKDPDLVNVTTETGTTVSGGIVYEVTVEKLPDPVYFKTFTLNQSSYTHVGIQVLKPTTPAGLAAVKKAKFKNRNTFGHWIEQKSGTAFFLVRSWDDLSIPE